LGEGFHKGRREFDIRAFLGRNFFFPGITLLFPIKELLPPGKGGGRIRKPIWRAFLIRGFLSGSQKIPIRAFTLFPNLGFIGGRFFLICGFQSSQEGLIG